MHKTWLRFFRSSPLEFVLNGCSLALSESYIWLGSHKEVPPLGVQYYDIVPVYVPLERK